jgi:tRNA threonylcarbamoyladenosine biosynthesis protein TsaE
MKYISESEKDTYAFAQKIAKTLKGGEVIGLIGELGAGKTTFTKAIAKDLKIKKNITSPTFVLMKAYPVKLTGSKIKHLVHIDAYRLKTNANILSIGIEEYFNRPDTVVIIEWADRIKKTLPKKTKYITINHKEDDKRLINY